MTETKVYTMDECSTFAADRQAGAQLEVDEELWYYFLEVLPPVHMGYTATVPEPDGTGSRKIHASFGFAEGWERVTAFWRKDGHYFAQLTKEVNPHA